MTDISKAPEEIMTTHEYEVLRRRVGMIPDNQVAAAQYNSGKTGDRFEAILRSVIEQSRGVGAADEFMRSYEALIQAEADEAWLDAQAQEVGKR
jgi:hypothetical protein